MSEKIEADIQVPSEYYAAKRYGSLERFISYYHQCDSLRQYRGKHVLLVGVGDGLVPYYLKTICGVKITTLDFDPALSPDIVADIRSIPRPDDTFDAVAVFEVLEHLPFSEFGTMLKELTRVSRGDVIVSIPYRHTGIDIAMKFPFVRTLLKRDYVRLLLTIPVRFPGVEICKQHYWELDNKLTTFKIVRRAIEEYCEIRNSYPSFFDAYRHFFILRKKKITLTDTYVREYYNAHLTSLAGSYTHERWHTTPERRFDFQQTLRALQTALSQVGATDARVLEVGPGDGVWTREVFPRASTLTLLDQSSEMIARAQATLGEQPKIDYYTGDFLTYTADTPYELIVAMRCFEYFENKEQAAEQIKSLLSDGGRMIMVTKNPRYRSQQDKTDKLLHTGQMTRQQIISLCERHELSVEAIYPATYRWKAVYAPMRWLFSVLHQLSLWTHGSVRVPWLEERATESYLYIISKTAP